jgi:hypothetical protein
MPIPIKSSKDFSGNVGPNLKDDGNLYSSHKFTILFWVCISIACMGLCVIACWLKFDKKPAQTQSTSSSSRPRSTRRNASQTPPRREISESFWWNVFAKMGENSTSKGWLALRHFASRSKSQAGDDIEMQRQPRNAGNTSGNPVQADPSLRSGARGTSRLQRPEHLRTDRSRIEGRRAEVERQRAREAWERLEARVGATYEPDSIPARSSQPPTYLPTAPEPIARPNANRVENLSDPIFDEESPNPIIEVPPPMYAEHIVDEIAYLSDYQNPAHAAEEVRDVQGLPPYALPTVALNSALRPVFI